MVNGLVPSFALPSPHCLSCSFCLLSFPLSFRRPGPNLDWSPPAWGRRPLYETGIYGQASLGAWHRSASTHRPGGSPEAHPRRRKVGPASNRR